MASAQRPPNIVFAFADDWGRYASAYIKHQAGPNLNQVLHTPNFDRLAAEGALFLNALVPAPTCTPCRSSLLSGQYFWQTGLGAILQGAQWDESIPTFPLELERSGYFIGYTYKVWAPGKTVNAPIGGRRTRYEPAGNNFMYFSHWVTEHAEELGIEGAKDALFAEARSNFQGFLAARPADKPFFYWFGPGNTHRTWERGSGKELWRLEPDTLKGRLPKFLPDVHEVREDVADYLGECMAFDRTLGILFEELEAAGELENTLIVASGDHGIPGMPRSKCNLYDIGCEVALAARWPGRIMPGRVVSDFVNIMDLAPTFLDACNVPVPSSMAGKSHSLLPILLSRQAAGQIEPGRDHVVTGRERHIAAAREGFLPYPQRSLRTKDFLYVVNFEPDRWPMGDPQGLDNLSHPAPDRMSLLFKTAIAFPDMDSSPTKAYIIQHRKEEDVEPLYQLAFGKRPREELYDLQSDPDYMRNVALDLEYDEVRRSMESRLLSILREQADPRLTEQPCRFESGPYCGFPPKDLEGKPWQEQFRMSADEMELSGLGSFGASIQTSRPTLEQVESDKKVRARERARL